MLARSPYGETRTLPQRGGKTYTRVRFEYRAPLVA